MKNHLITRKKLLDGRFIYYVDIGDLPPKKIASFMETVKELIELYNESKDESISPHTFEENAQ